MDNLCIIPARGGSKRIPRKNIKDFLGKPIIAYSIEAALGSDLFSEVMVSTDDAEIAKIAKQYGAQVPFMRSEKNSSDFATTFNVLEEVIDNYKKENKDFEHICCLYPCAPFVTNSILKTAFKNLIQDNGKSIFPVVEFSYPIQRALKIEDLELKYDNEEYKNSRSQDLEKRYHDSGQFYLMKSSVVKNKEEIVGNDCRTLVVNELEVQDIDTLTDWKFAELKYKLLNNG